MPRSVSSRRVSSFSTHSAIVGIPSTRPILAIESTIAAVEGAVDKIAHERAVDLEEVDGQRLEVGEGAQPRAEVVESETAADALQALEEMYRFREVADGRGLRDLEANGGGLDAERVDLLVHELEERLVAERRSGQVDRDDAPRIGRDPAFGHQT